MNKLLIAMLCTFFLLHSPAVSESAPKTDLPALLAAAKTSVEETAAKVGNYPLALNEIERARASLKKGEETYDKGKQWMGLGSLKPEAELEVLHHLKIVQVANSLALSRAAKGRNDEESAATENQLTLVKARVKLLEARKAETEQLRQAVQKSETVVKELETVKAEAEKSKAQIEQLAADKKKLEAQVSALESEKAALHKQLETLKKQPEPAPPATPPAKQ